MFSSLPDLRLTRNNANSHHYGSPFTVQVPAAPGAVAPGTHAQAVGRRQRRRQQQQQQAQQSQHQQQPQPRSHHQTMTIGRTALARQRAAGSPDRRNQQAIANFGATWLRPPGVGKTLHQMREERREQEEHAEALRRERLAQQLADAEAQAAATFDFAEAEDGDGGADDDGRDLDDEIPDGDADGFGLDGAGSDDGDSDSDSDTGGDDDDGGQSSGADAGEQAELRREIRRIQANEDRVRDALARSQQAAAVAEAAIRRPDILGLGGDDIDDEDLAEMLEEDDLVVPAAPARHNNTTANNNNAGADPNAMDLDVDLDDDIPEAESGVYEHTDSEADMTSSSDDDGAIDPPPHFQRPPRGPSLGPGPGPGASARFRTSLPRSGGGGGGGSSNNNTTGRTSIDISSLLSRDGSSSSAMASSSPRARRR